jgi:hypothetical protein
MIDAGRDDAQRAPAVVTAGGEWWWPWWNLENGVAHMRRRSGTYPFVVASTANAMPGLAEFVCFITLVFVEFLVSGLHWARKKSVGSSNEWASSSWSCNFFILIF